MGQQNRLNMSLPEDADSDLHYFCTLFNKLYIYLSNLKPLNLLSLL